MPEKIGNGPLPLLLRDPTMFLGFTGTHKGMSAKQKLEFIALLHELKPKEFHHGCCVGADADAHSLVRGFDPNVRIVGHPPINMRMVHHRVMGDCNHLETPRAYLARNHNIVHATAVLVATPKTHTEELRSGTWATVRYARNRGGVIRMIYP